MLDAVVPCAGRGTRMLPATKAVPEVLLPLGRRPVVQRVAEELAGCGVRRVVLVCAPDGDAVAAHFAGEPPTAPRGVAVQAVAQPGARGPGDAVLCARRSVRGPFLVAHGEVVLGAAGQSTVAARLAAALESGAAAAVAVHETPAPPGRHGTVAVDRQDVVREIVPAARGGPVVPGRLAIAARYALMPLVFEALDAIDPDDRGELQLTDALAALVAGGERVAAVRLAADEPAFDVTGPAEYAEAFAHFARLDA